jgi:hypothetical protein
MVVALVFTGVAPKMATTLLYGVAYRADNVRNNIAPVHCVTLTDPTLMYRRPAFRYQGMTRPQPTRAVRTGSVPSRR